MTKDAADEPRQATQTLARVRRRGDFVRASKSGARLSRPAFALQMAERRDDAEGAARFGFTVTKKVAGAVGRNRIRRRLKEALRLIAGAGARVGRDYVFIARPAALTMPFDDILSQMADGLARLDGRRSGPNRRNP
jgi:ribonuclease P protein component